MKTLTIKNKEIKVNISTEHIVRIDLALKSMKFNAFTIGEHLTEIKKEVEADGQGKLLFEIAAELFGFQKSNTYNYMKLYDRFGEKREKFETYNISQLTEMLALPEEIISEVTPKMTIREIREFKRGLNKDEHKQTQPGTQKVNYIDVDYVQLEDIDETEMEENTEQQQVIQEKNLKTADWCSSIEDFEVLTDEEDNLNEQSNSESFRVSGNKEKSYEEIVKQNEILLRRNRKRTKELLELKEKQSVTHTSDMDRRDSDRLKEKLMKVEYNFENRLRKRMGLLGEFILEMTENEEVDIKNILQNIRKQQFQTFDEWLEDKNSDKKIQKRLAELLINNKEIKPIMDEFGVSSLGKTSYKAEVITMIEDSVIVRMLDDEEIEININDVKIFYKTRYKDEFIGVERIHNNGFKLEEKFTLCDLKESHPVYIEKVEYKNMGNDVIVYYIRPEV